MAPEEAKIPTPVLKSASQPLRIHVMRLWQKIMVFGLAHGALESKPRRSHVQRWRSIRCVMDLGGLKSPRRSVMVVILALHVGDVLSNKTSTCGWSEAPTGPLWPVARRMELDWKLWGSAQGSPMPRRFVLPQQIRRTRHCYMTRARQILRAQKTGRCLDVEN